MTDDREAQLAEAEHRFGVSLPQDYRQFILQAEGTEESESTTGDYRFLYPPTELVDLDEAGEHQQRFPGGLAIGGDGSREVLFYDFRQDPPPLVLTDITAEAWTAALFQTPSLTELLDRFPQTRLELQERRPVARAAALGLLATSGRHRPARRPHPGSGRLFVHIGTSVLAHPKHSSLPAMQNQ